MCGIFGIFSNNQIPDFERPLSSALEALRHRGPDDSGIEMFTLASGNLALGHTRLSIIDLSPGGHQPMRSTDGRHWIVFNGEIYNYLELRNELQTQGHAFISNSDTEVLLSAWATWGSSCLQRVVGMFAFVIYDSQEGTLTCVRDPFGIKPLFYSIYSGNFFFASEIQALIRLRANRPELDWQRSYDYLVFSDYDSKERTFIKDIFHLMPGHMMIFNIVSGELGLPTPWFKLRIEESFTGTFDDAAQILREQFFESIRLHLRSDVPLGVGLSGGIDSSAVAACIRKVEPDIPINTFSYVASGSTVCEEKWIDIVNAHVNAHPNKVLLSADDLLRDLDDMILAQGEPFGSTSIYAQYRVYKMARDRGVTVVLDGQGADELLAGYDGYPGCRIRSMIEKGRLKSLMIFANSWSEWPGRSRRDLMTYVARELVPTNVKYAINRILRPASMKPPWLKAGILEEAGVELNPSHAKVNTTLYGRRLIESLAAAAFERGLPALLRHGDRNSMRFSVESRVPFLTLPLAQFLFSLPESYLLSNNGETKSVFRAAMRGIVPDDILDRKDKIGFRTPEQNWFGAFRDQLRCFISEPLGIPFLNYEEIVNHFDRFLAQNETDTTVVWRWINFMRWVTITGLSR